MAIYDLTNGIPSQIMTGDILNCPYTGYGISVELPRGKYKLECWGAQGGTNGTLIGGPGGYARGTLATSVKTGVCIYSGEAGGSVNRPSFNGGGGGIINGKPGGGASDIRINSDSFYARAIVAGGGGGAGVGTYGVNPAGCGGGLWSGDGRSNDTTGRYPIGQDRCGGSASQTSGGRAWNQAVSAPFGQGSNASGYSCGGGGGGWYGGAGAYDSDSDADGKWGSGGSGYIYAEDSAANYPSGCLLDNSHYLTDAILYSGNTDFLSPDGVLEFGHRGNGYARITVISLTAPVLRLLQTGKKVELNWTLPTSDNHSPATPLNIYRDNTLIFTTSDAGTDAAGITSYEDLSIDFDNIYTYKVELKINNVIYSDQMSIITQGVKDVNGDYSSWVKTQWSTDVAGHSDFNDTLFLNWDVYPGADYYLIYRDRELIDTSPTNKYSDAVPPNGNFVYEVFAILHNGDVYITLGLVDSRKFTLNSNPVISRILSSRGLDEEKNNYVYTLASDNESLLRTLIESTYNPHGSVRIGRTVLRRELAMFGASSWSQFLQDAFTCSTDTLPSTYLTHEVAVWRNYEYQFQFSIGVYSYYYKSYQSQAILTFNVTMPDSYYTLTPDSSLSGKPFLRGTTVRSKFSGGISEAIIPPGVYLIRMYGANGGDGYQNASYKGIGGDGACLSFSFAPKKITSLYLAPGGKGVSNILIDIGLAAGGYNGGGSGRSYSGGGGGCSSITAVSKLPADLAEEKDKVIAIAGGGGGAMGYISPPGCAGGDGGIPNGGNGNYSPYWNNAAGIGIGGTQSGSVGAAGFGRGGPAGTTYRAGGGSGWYGGSEGTSNGTSGGGGSSKANSESYSLSDIVYTNKKNTEGPLEGQDGAIYITRTSTVNSIEDNFRIQENYNSNIIDLSFSPEILVSSYSIVRYCLEDDEEIALKTQSNITSLSSFTYSDQKFKNNRTYAYQIRYNNNGVSVIHKITTPKVRHTVTSKVNTNTVSIHPGDIIDCPFDPSANSIKLPAGKYKLECWGAQGGCSSANLHGGLGGYSRGYLNTTRTNIIYTYTGGAGTGNNIIGSLIKGGFNGGGNSYSDSTSYRTGSGGGASDIRINSTSLYARALVAGGGGGYGLYSSYRIGGYGGGASGGSCENVLNIGYYGGTGGTIDTPGKSYYASTVNSPNHSVLATFGSGGGAKSDLNLSMSGGGSGWYGGGASYVLAAGGGSGYAFTSDTASSYPTGCLLDSSYYLTDAITLGGNVVFDPPIDGVSSTTPLNGYIRIECIDLLSFDQDLSFISTIDKENNVSLSWNSVTYNGNAPTGFKLLRNNSLITTVNNKRYFDTDTDWNSTYNYEVLFTFSGGLEISRSISMDSLISYYDLTSATTKVIDAKRNTIINCSHMETPRAIILPPGKYQLEAWGAQGGYYSATDIGGKGGYSKGVLEILETVKLFLYTGGQGAFKDNIYGTLSGGYNGGGKGYLRYAGSGGGASDIRINSTSLYSRVLVAGGGGGGAYYNSDYRGSGGAAGGLIGSPGYHNKSSTTLRDKGPGQGGSQTAGGLGGYFTNLGYEGKDGGFGFGGDAVIQRSQYASLGGGGSGWYGGGAAGGHNEPTYWYYGSSGGGGGSGYVYTHSSFKDYPDGGLLNHTYCLSSIDVRGGGETIVDPTGENVIGHSGDGHILIKCITPLTPLVLDNPINFRGMHYTKRNVLKWDRALVDGVPMSYRLYREDKLIYTGADTEFKDTELDDLTVYGYILMIEYENKIFKTSIGIDPAAGYIYKDGFKGMYFKINGNWFIWEPPTN